MKRVNKTAFSAVAAALATVIMYIGSLFDKIDLASAFLASVCVAVVMAEVGFRRAIAVYAVSALLAFVVLPSKTVSVLFTAFFGYYPVIVAYFKAKFPPITAIFAKHAVATTVFALLMILSSIVAVKIHIVVMFCVLVLVNLLIPICDLAYSAALRLYGEKIRGRFL